jgi:hypothetical protein
VGTVHLTGPGEPRGKCVFCLAAAKQVQWDQYQDQIRAGFEAGGDKVTWIPWPPGLDKMILDGPYRAVPGDAPGLGVVDGLCWDHVAGLGQRSGLAAAPGPLPPGLIKGKG